jgi:hypothetical protein
MAWVNLEILARVPQAPILPVPAGLEQPDLGPERGIEDPEERELARVLRQAKDSGIDPALVDNEDTRACIRYKIDTDGAWRLDHVHAAKLFAATVEQRCRELAWAGRALTHYLPLSRNRNWLQVGRWYARLDDLDRDPREPRYPKPGELLVWPDPPDCTLGEYIYYLQRRRIHTDSPDNGVRLVRRGKKVRYEIGFGPEQLPPADWCAANLVEPTLAYASDMRQFFAEAKNAIGRLDVTGTPKGVPGRRAKYSAEAHDYARKLRTDAPDLTAGEIRRACRNRFPGEPVPPLDKGRFRAWLLRPGKKRTQ